MPIKRHIAVIGGGPAGLRAAQVATDHGAEVTVYDAMPSVGRKFLVAGKSGLNLTFDEPWESFLEKYSGHSLPKGLWREMLSSFDNQAIQAWAHDLGITTFTASSGKVFPTPVNGHIRAAPLLRRWVEYLRLQGVTFKSKHKWLGFNDLNQPIFEHLGKRLTVNTQAVILALGGASWPQTGSDGTWTSILESYDVGVTSLQPANCGWEVDWPAPLLDEAAGSPLKNITIHVGEHSKHGELVITRYGIEGSPIYRLGPYLRSIPKPEITIDLKPHTTESALIAKMGNVRRNFVREARRRWKLDPAACAILKHMPDRGPWSSVSSLVKEVKRCHIPLTQPRPISEAISSSGGIAWNELDPNLMLKKIPNVYIAGEMLDWEAPTGGYLLQACFATGNHAGLRAARG